MAQSGAVSSSPDEQASEAQPGQDNPARSASGEQRHILIAAAAYYRAQQRGFAPGCELEDWLAAEAEVDAQLKPA